MDISAVSTLANSNNTSAVADKLKNNVKNLSSDSTEDELKSTLKDFESYFVEQVIKEMKDSVTLKSDDEDSSMSQYKDMFMDTVIEQMSDTIVEKSGAADRCRCDQLPCNAGEPFQSGGHHSPGQPPVLQRAGLLPEILR